jgi:probable 2-oxoglutarate dehydrogenase E1 component DHKTD1
VIIHDYSNLIGLLRYPARHFFWKVQGNSEFPEGVDGVGDVLSHIGQSVDLEFEGKKLHVTLLQNPSHLENGNPVAMGKSRAKQFHSNDMNREKTLCVMFHGDAAIYGQVFYSPSPILTV